MTKGFLSQLGVAFTVRDLNVDAVARQEFLRAGYRLPPVVVVDGAAIEGFQPERIEAAIEAAESRREADGRTPGSPSRSAPQRSDADGAGGALR